MNTIFDRQFSESQFEYLLGRKTRGGDRSLIDRSTLIDQSVRSLRTCKRLVPINSTSRSSRPTDVLWPCHTLLGSRACLRKYLAVLKLLLYYANNTNLLYQI